MSQTPIGQAKHIRVQHLAEAKSQGHKLVMLTAYDQPTAQIFDQAGIELLLVGDSMGNTMLGYQNTLPVSLKQMAVAVSAVAAGARRALVVADLPFGTYESGPARCLDSAVKLLKAGAHAVKFEGGRRVAKQIELLSQSGIPVMAHLGFTPQSINLLGGSRVQGRDAATAEQLKAEALSVQKAGAFALVLEMVPAKLATDITNQLSIPTIGIGAGSGTDGQVLVWTDMAGVSDWVPSFVRKFGDLRGALTTAATDYAAAVRSGTYPDQGHSFQ